MKLRTVGLGEANTLSIDANLIDAVEAIESTVKRLAVVVSQNNDVLGTLHMAT